MYKSSYRLCPGKSEIKASTRLCRKMTNVMEAHGCTFLQMEPQLCEMQAVNLTGCLVSLLQRRILIMKHLTVNQLRIELLLVTPVSAPA